MPLYDYRCDGCGAERELRRSFAEAADYPLCCGKPMWMKISVAAAQVPETGRDKVLGTLNRTSGRRLPANARDMPRMERALAKGLSQTRPIIGVGI